VHPPEIEQALAQLPLEVLQLLVKRLYGTFSRAFTPQTYAALITKELHPSAPAAHAPLPTE
jgi:hypothetical protein